MNFDYWDKKGIIIGSIILVVILGLIATTAVFAVNWSSANTKLSDVTEEYSETMESWKTLMARAQELGKTIDGVSGTVMSKAAFMMNSGGLTAAAINQGLYDMDMEIARAAGQAGGAWLKFKQDYNIE